MELKAARTIAAAIIGCLSLAGAIQSVRMQVDGATLLASLVPAGIVPIQAGVLPPGTTLPPAPAPMRPAQQAALRRMLWATPLDPRTFNLLYADHVRTGQPRAVTDRQATILSRLGWRHVPAELNLIVRAVEYEDYGAVVDLVDALLRRQKLPEFANATLSAMEAIPQIHGEVVQRLLARPRWRQDYLSAIGPQSDEALLEARVRTVQTLLRQPGGMTRAEIAPSLIAMTGGGHARAAHALWLRSVGARNRGVYDPDFRHALSIAGKGEPIPFEWRFGHGFGYSVEPTQQGVTIDWDGRGLPTFLTQHVSLTPGRGHILTLAGRSSVGSLPALLTPVIACGDATVRFTPLASAASGARYRSDMVPNGCAIGVLTISGHVDGAAGGVTIDLSQVGLSPENA